MPTNNSEVELLEQAASVIRELLDLGLTIGTMATAHDWLASYDSLVEEIPLAESSDRYFSPGAVGGIKFALMFPDGAFVTSRVKGTGPLELACLWENAEQAQRQASVWREHEEQRPRVVMVHLSVSGEDASPPIPEQQASDK